MKELRTAVIDIPDSADEGNLIINGSPIVFNVETEIHDPKGSYKEIIRAGALDGADLSDIRLLYNHDMNRLPMARTPKTLSFTVDSAGLNMRAVLPDTEEGRSLYTAVKRGDLSGMSFAFKVPNGGSHYDSKTNTRTITKIEKVYEFSIVPFPAYSKTSVEAREQMTEAKLQSKKREMAKIKINQIRKRVI